MWSFFAVALFAPRAFALTHHLAVGTTDGQALYSLEMDDAARSVYLIQARDAAGASPSLTLDYSKKHLFGSRPSDGTLTRYSIAPTYEFVSEGTMEIPKACNTTKFTSLHLTSSTKNFGIWGSASTGTCSVLFGLTSDGYTTLRSREIAGDIHSLAFSPSGRNLRALDSHSSTATTTSITNFRISDEPNLEDIIGTDVLTNVSSASQIIAHPNGNRIYVVTKDTNELIAVPLSAETSRRRATLSQSRYKLLPSSIDATQFQTSSLAITASKRVLWTLSQSPNQAVVTAFTLNATTGDVIEVGARATWKGAGEGQLTAAPFEAGDVVAISNSPMGYVTLLGLDYGTVATSQSSEQDFLEELPLEREKRGVEAAAPKIRSFGRTALDDYVGLGESVWID
ncbi:hypothetical protein IQ07DRAFT_594611 [Pyrenochaeta sp. DS3sAY3a]|nr:hypothetical protein IQ07DRAFT_594611 [Pyrenochaeta sp. DS3sAY3a]